MMYQIQVIFQKSIEGTKLYKIIVVQMQNN